MPDQSPLEDSVSYARILAALDEEDRFVARCERMLNRRVHHFVGRAGRRSPRRSTRRTSRTSRNRDGGDSSSDPPPHRPHKLTSTACDAAARPAVLP
jgi:hypothetical protein